MPPPKNHRARKFYLAALQRYEDAEILLDRSRLTGAVYLAGYGVECILKALILSSITDPARREATDQSFRGQVGHNLVVLTELYKKESGRIIPGKVSRQLTFVSTWKTDLRYEASIKTRKQAVDFLSAVAEVIRWAEGA